jgi:hypothetical protein
MSKDILGSADHEMIFLYVFVKGKWLLYNRRGDILGGWLGYDAHNMKTFIEVEE